MEARVGEKRGENKFVGRANKNNNFSNGILDMYDLFFIHTSTRGSFSFSDEYFFIDKNGKQISF